MEDGLTLEKAISAARHHEYVKQEHYGRVCGQSKKPQYKPNLGAKRLGESCGFNQSCSAHMRVMW